MDYYKEKSEMIRTCPYLHHIPFPLFGLKELFHGKKMKNNVYKEETEMTISKCFFILSFEQHPNLQ